MAQPIATEAKNTCLDAIVIGAGICGVTFLKYARDCGLSCLVLEKEPRVGGVLHPYIQLGREVTSTIRLHGRWQVTTRDRVFFARYLVAATGVQNRPWQPTIQRQGAAVLELHS